MSACIIFISHIAEYNQGKQQCQDFDTAHVGSPLPADRIPAAYFHDNDKKQNGCNRKKGDINRQFMPYRRLKADFRRRRIIQAPHICTALVVGFGRIALYIRSRWKRDNIFQVRPIFFNGHSQSQFFNAVSSKIIINIIGRTKESVMGLMHDAVNGAAVGTIFGNGLHSPESLAIVVVIIHDRIIPLLKLIRISPEFLLTRRRF